MKKALMVLGLAVAGIGLFVLGRLAGNLPALLDRDRPVARVGDQTVTESDLKKEIIFLKVSKTIPVSDITREDVLDRLINDQLILMEGRRLQILLLDETVDAYLDNFWKAYPPHESGRILQEHGLTPAVWRELIAKRLLIEQIIKQVVEDQVHIGQDEVEEYYWTHLLEFNRQDQIHARQIVVETREQADAVKKKINEGASFIEMAKQYSRGPEKDLGGDLGWVSSNDLPRAFSNVLFKLRAQETSQPVATEYGYHLFMVEEHRQGGKIPLDEAKQKIAEELKLAKIDRVFQAWLEDLRGKNAIEILDRRGGE